MQRRVFWGVWGVSLFYNRYILADLEDRYGPPRSWAMALVVWAFVVAVAFVVAGVVAWAIGKPTS